ncbi:oxygen-dependent tRNA uridine(34) hydroxylase TrhO [Paenibacillus endoradicis]|uniref:oxygen-dependent tRNA uridine(34) hydroxylase TrhO n=1 Tax=Paenibacillus endoradicis TaxID=2972487 RepID=UPI0021596754|nr:rhodanese-related sulfurtransferase [Paenibacillus endoradicis]MCR8657102.1 rhodanese-related sulfurtransferase [Paenibacillus endoradicis]
MDYRILLYYHYTTIEDSELFAKEHLAFCKSLELKGRILVAYEGINGTVSGSVEQTNAYMAYMNAHPLFQGIVFKIDESETHAFKKMHVRSRPELVNLSLEDDINPLEVTGRYVEPADFYKEMQQEDTIVIDARNTYEFDVGHFEGAIRPDIESFRELPQWIRDNHEMLDGKKILTYCTGGIRCEKFSGWLVREGYEDVGQLHGGIVSYGKDSVAKGQLWNGQCYVFDERLVVPINQVNPVIVGKDHFTGEPCERYINCANPECNKQILASEENEHKHMGSCTPACVEHPHNLYVARHNLSTEEVQLRLSALLQEVTK